jgi:hypothetical protein
MTSTFSQFALPFCGVFKIVDPVFTRKQSCFLSISGSGTFPIFDYIYELLDDRRHDTRKYFLDSGALPGTLQYEANITRYKSQKQLSID